MLVYVHIPFCKSKCAYCDFNSVAGCDEATVFSYLTALNREIGFAAKRFPEARIETVYIGGGTPSSLKPERICALIDKLASSFSGFSPSEITVEVNPDDIVTKGTKEPYRLLSARSEYRLLTRSDNADVRLLEKGYKLGMNSLERYEKFKKKAERISFAINQLENKKIASDKNIRSYICSLNFPDPNGSENLKQTMKRQNVTYAGLRQCCPDLIELTKEEELKCETEIKYEGYIAAELKEAERRREYENLLLPLDIDYKHLDGLSLEAREKLSIIKPKTLGEASRITNVHPSDIDVLSFYVRHLNKEDHKEKK